jgi:hypothetical protein
MSEAHPGSLVAPPDLELRRALTRLGPDGSRAYDFLVAACRQVETGGSRVGELAAYAIREGLMSLVALGGQRLTGVGEAAREVVRRSDLAQRGRLSQDGVDEAIASLAATIERPGSNERRLELAVLRVARERPTRATADLLDQFVRVLDTANAGLHAEITADTAEDLYERAVQVVRALFGPITARFAAIDELLAVEQPGQPDVQRLQALVGDERHLLYFFDTVEGAAWFHALSDTPMLTSPPENRWAAGPYVERLAQAEPDLVREWLTLRASEPHNAKQAGDYLWTAQAVRSDIVPVALSLVTGHLAELRVQSGVERFLRLAAPEALAASAGRSLIKQALDALLAKDLGAGDTYLVSEVAAVALRAMRFGDARSWLRVLTYRLCPLAERESALRLRVLIPFDQLNLSPSNTPLELMVALVIAAGAVAGELGLSIDEQLLAASLLPDPLAARVSAHRLNQSLPSAREQAETFILTQIATSDDPTPEELSLLRRLNDGGSDEWPSQLRDALGAPPSSAILDGWASGTDVSAEARRAHFWLVAMPAEVCQAWSETEAALQKLLVPATVDGVLMRPAIAMRVSASTPFSVQALNDLDPLSAARLVGAWSAPENRSFGAPNPRGLASALQSAVAARPDAWMAADPRDVTDALADPIYIGAYIGGLRDSPPTDLAHLEELITVIATLQAEHTENGTVEPAWKTELDTSVQLLVRLSRRVPTSVRDKALDIAITAARARNDGSMFGADTSPLDQAINRFSTRALEAAFMLGESDETMNPKVLELIEESLSLEDLDGLQARAILAPRLARLRHLAPDWFEQQRDLIFGESAPDRLGTRTFDLYLQWGPAYGPFLDEYRDEIGAAIGRIGEHARTQLLHGLLWQLAGYSGDEVLDLLVEHGAEQVSEAGHWLGWALARSSVAPLEPALSLWEAAIARDLPTDAYFGWGWWTTIERFDEDRWLALTAQTLEKGHANVAEADRVATRAARSPSNPHAYTILTRLLEGSPPVWDLETIGEAGLQLLDVATVDPLAWGELQERLLERGFHEAANKAPPHSAA